MTALNVIKEAPLYVNSKFTTGPKGYLRSEKFQQYCNSCIPFKELLVCEIVEVLGHPMRLDRLIRDGENDPTRFPEESSAYSKKPLNCDVPDN
jgi:hypothetical protein